MRSRFSPCRKVPFLSGCLAPCCQPLRVSCLGDNRDNTMTCWECPLGGDVTQVEKHCDDRMVIERKEWGRSRGQLGRLERGDCASEEGGRTPQGDVGLRVPCALVKLLTSKGVIAGRYPLHTGTRDWDGPARTPSSLHLPTQHPNCQSGTWKTPDEGSFHVKQYFKVQGETAGEVCPALYWEM